MGRMPKAAYVYMLASRKNGTIYTGVTSDLEKRMFEHKTKVYKGFTKKYNVNSLVWYIDGEDINSAIELEKKIKNRGRQWKIKLIEKDNPGWRDLSADFLDPATIAQDDAQGDKEVK
jgi:putative endonuclease